MSNGIFALTGERSRFFGLLGNVILYAFPVLGILGALALLALEQYQYLILSIYLIVPIICAPIAYVIIRKKQETGSTISDELFKFLVAGFFICFAFSLTLLYAFDIRPTVYYFVMAAMATLIFIQIVRSQITQGKVVMILLQVMALALNLCWGISLHYFQYIGRTDILLHTYYTNSLVELGHVTQIFYDYQPFPLWHIMNAGIYLAGGAEFPVHKVIAIAGGLAFALLPLVVYLIGVKLFKDNRIALIAALITVFFPDMIVTGTSTIPRIVAEILMVFLIYLLLAGKSRTKYLLIVPIMAAIIIYHSISILFTALILFVLYIMQMLFMKKEERFVSIWYVVLALAMTGVYWVLNAGMLIQRLINNATASTDTLTIPKALTENVPWNELFNYLQYVPSILFILTGVLLLLMMKSWSSRAKVFGLAALGFVWISFPGPLMMIGKLVQGFGIDRFAEYTFLITILIAAVGIAGLFFRSGRYGKAIIIGLFCVWALLAISNDWVASDNPLVKRPFYTYYFSEQEITGMDRLVTHVTGVLESDYVPNRYYEGSTNEAYTTILQVDVPNMTFVRHGPEDIFLIREGEHDKRELRVAALDNSKFISKPEGDRFIYVDRNESVWDTLAGYSRVYDSRAIQAYI
jgi:uncharacterized membrane protein